MQIGEAKLLAEESGEVLLSIPTRNPLMAYQDWVDFIKNTLNHSEHIQGFQNGKDILVSEQNTHAIDLDLTEDELILKIRYTDSGNAREAYELKVYAICDVEEKGGES